MSEGPETPQNEESGILSSLLEDAKHAQTGGVHGLKNKLMQKGSRLVLSSQVWLHALQTHSCDLLLTLPPSHPHAQAVATWLIDQIRRKEPRLKIEARYHALSDTYGLYFTARYDSLLKGAELLRLKKPVKEIHGGGQREFTYEEADIFQGVEVKSCFLTDLERASIMKTFLEGVRARESSEKLKGGTKDGQPLFQIRGGQSVVSALISKGFVANVQPLHHPDRLKRLKDTWIKSLSPQPLEEIRDYFGTQIGLYFAWLGHYTRSLCFPALLGLVMWWLGMTVGGAADKIDHWTSDVCFVVFALFNCIWGTVYLEAWKRRQAELAYRWGTLGVEGELLSEPRPLFRGELEMSPVSGRLEPEYPSWKRRTIRYCFSYPIIFLCMCVMFCIMLAIFEFQEFCTAKFATSTMFLSWITVTPKVLLGVVVFFSDENFTKLAGYLNDLENYRTDDAYENNLIIKIVIFQFVNAFLSLFYIGFYLQDMERLSVQLAALLITRQVIGNITEAGIPYIKEKLLLSRMAYQMTRRMSHDSLQRHVTQIKEQARLSTDATGEPTSGDDWSPSDPTRSNIATPTANESETESKIPHSMSNQGLSSESEAISSSDESRFLRRRNTTSAAQPPLRKNTRLPLPEFKVTTPQLTQAELESLLPRYTSPLTDYLEMFIQFGYVLLFSPAFPLAAFCAILNNFLEIRVDAFKICSTLQRPFGRRVENIGSWMAAMEMMGVIGVMVNCVLIGQSGLVQRIWPDISLSGQILIVVTLEKEARLLQMETHIRLSHDKDSPSCTTTNPNATNNSTDSTTSPRRRTIRPTSISPMSPTGSRTRSVTPATRNKMADY